MTDTGAGSVAEVAREAVRLYFDPLIRLRRWLSSPSPGSDRVTYAPRQQMRREEDRKTYSFAVAFGLLSVVTGIVAVVSVVRLWRVEDILRSTGTSYVIDLRPTADSLSGQVVGRSIANPEHSLASVLTPIQTRSGLEEEGLSLRPMIRASTIDGLWVALDPAVLQPDGTFLVKVPPAFRCRDCQATVLLLPEHSVRTGDRFLALPAANAASQIVPLSRPQ